MVSSLPLTTHTLTHAQPVRLMIFTHFPLLLLLVWGQAWITRINKFLLKPARDTVPLKVPRKVN